MSEGRVEFLYQTLKARAVGFEFRPGERINEGMVAKELNASRTPLREAMNRLVAEQLVEFRSGQGFFCRALDPTSIFELYEMRMIIETAAARRACQRATTSDIAALRDQLEADGLTTAGLTIREVVTRDEAFHLGIARLVGNSEVVRHLDRINERIRFIRWVDMGRRVRTTKGEHLKIMEALEARDSERAAAVLKTHVMRRMDEIVAAVREGYSNIFMADPEELFDRLVPDGD
ncbi:GntR family transcriptional regulator [Psychromarinibacter sp. C21-152]|uniref:GntR family transcriptional regulator n=1 Tax=Psychromarinibacter sediminicola TaxID=3033385 RepID=A0AAE3NPK5_9RHOB|nr:GntR family transcriptional regulator [Psychromarinibacter sediminicola]MDF0599682.1 GntR family transcriptional regulator [Psychromarinibacter sediminicola]